MPNTALIAAAASDARKLNCSAASTRSLVSVSKNCDQPSVADLKTRLASGIRTISESQVSVRPSVNPNPGMTERLR